MIFNFLNDNLHRPYPFSPNPAPYGKHRIQSSRGSSSFTLVQVRHFHNGMLGLEEDVKKGKYPMLSSHMCSYTSSCILAPLTSPLPLQNGSSDVELAKCKRLCIVRSKIDGTNFMKTCEHRWFVSTIYFPVKEMVTGRSESGDACVLDIESSLDTPPHGRSEWLLGRLGWVWIWTGCIEPRIRKFN
jgi:hypothetical protein